MYDIITNVDETKELKKKIWIKINDDLFIETVLDLRL